MTEFDALRPKKYSYVTGESDENKKEKVPKKCVIKIKIKFEDYKHCLEGIKLKNKMNHVEKKILMWITFERIIKNSWKTIV